MSNNVHIFLRACDKVNSLHGLSRPFGLDKKKTMQSCFKSLVKSIELAHEYTFQVTIIGDELSKEMVEFYQSSTIKPTIINEKFGNDNSLMKMFELAENLPDDDIVYFLEDDYLHYPHFFFTCFDFIRKSPNKTFTDGFFLHPTDYPDQYHRKDLIIPSLVILGELGHFRQVSSSTFTFMSKVSLVKKYISHFKSSTVNADDGFMSKIFQEVPIFSPLPGLATHMHEATMSPFMPWRELL